MVVLGCLGLFLKKKNVSVGKTSKEDEHAIIGYNFLGFSYRGRYKNQLSMIDVKSTRVREVSGLDKALRGDRIWMGNSCNGLILLESYSFSDRHGVILNPKSGNVVKRITPPVWLSCSPFGFFYHPLAKEYRTLNVIGVGNNRYEYHIYEFGSNTWRAALNPYFHFTPSKQRPTCTTQALFWCCKSDDGHKIVVFDIISEEFCMKPFPVCGSKEKELYTPPTLVAKNNKDSLCCCYVQRAELSIDVWVLEDYAKWSWNRKYVVDLDWCKTENYPSEAWRVFAKRAMSFVKVVSIQKDELVFYYRGGDTTSIHSYHLESGVSVTTQLSKTFWKKKVDYRKGESCGFIGL